MFGISICCSENATLFERPNYKCHIKSQPLEVTHDKAFIVKRLTGKMGYLAIPIWNAFFTTKSREGTSGGRFPGWASRSEGSQTLWGSPRWGRWSLPNPYIFQKASVITFLWWCIENKPKRTYSSRGRGGTRLPTGLCDSSSRLVNWALFQQCSGVQCPLNWDATRRWVWH